MGDRLEQFIVENREAFDDAEPSGKVWNGVNKRLGQNRRNFWQVAWKVAAVLFMVSTIYLLADRPPASPEEPQLSSEFRMAEDYYVELISVRRMEIEAQLSPEEQAEFLLEIDQLDEMYAQLKDTYQENAINERVVDAMITNLQLRLSILERQLEILENIKTKSDENKNT